MPNILKEKCKTAGTILFFFLLLAAAFAVMAPRAEALPTYLSNFVSTYPSSPLNSCLICHTTATASPSTRNPYGTAFAGAGHNFAAIESLDSDGDGFTNIAEINAGSYPGDPTSVPAAAGPTISTASPLPAGTSGTAYSQTFAASGGTAPYTWSIASGTLPAGLTLSSGGVLSGTPTAAGTFSFTVQVSGGGSVTKSFSLTINGVLVTLSSMSISGPSSVNEGATATYTATATWSDGSTTAVTPAWSVSPATYASVSASGVLTTQAVTSNQSVALTATYTAGTVTRTATRSVSILDSAATLESIAISGPSSVNEGATATCTATATWSDGSTTTVTPTWSVSPASYATISASGVLTANTVSSTVDVVVTAEYTSGGVTKSATLTVSILDVPARTGSLDVMPADNSVDVPVDTVIIVKDGTAADVSTLFNSDTFTLRSNRTTAEAESAMTPSWPYRSTACTSDGVVQGTFTYNATSTEATFTPNCPLANGTTYLASVAVVPGSALAAAYDWSFTTIAASVDSDGDGSPDNEDDDPHDGRRTSRWSSRGTGKFRIDSTHTEGTSIRGAVAIADTSSSLNQTGKPAGYTFPDGMIAFQEAGIASGSFAQVTVTFPSPIPAGSKVYQAAADGFHPVPSAIIDGNTVTLTVVSGSSSAQAAASASDNIASDNGVLVDPVGVAAPVSSGSGTIDLTNSAGGGCAVVGGTGDSAANADLFLVLAGFGVALWRKRMVTRRK